MFTPMNHDQVQHYLQPIQRLWKAVLMQQIMDIKSISNKQEASSYRKDAHSWLYHNRNDFDMVCDLMDLNPGYVREKIQQASKDHYQWRKGDSSKALSLEVLSDG